MDVTYVAQTESCVFLLDEQGICRASLPHADAQEKDRKIAARCEGAQYVASLDVSLPGILATDPKAGLPLVFARVGPQGRVFLIRTGALVEFREFDEALDGPLLALEDLDDEDEDGCTELTSPFARSVMPHETPIELSLETVTVETPVEKTPKPRDSEPETMRGPRTVRGFPPPPAQRPN